MSEAKKVEIIDPMADYTEAPPQPKPSDDEEKVRRERIRTLEHQLVALRTEEVEAAEPVLAEEPKDAGEVILIHFVEDGFTAFGQIWHRGQELEFVVGSDGFTQTVDRAGQSWVFLDEAAQMQRWGKVWFRRGPWPGAQWEQGAQEEQRRSRRVPIFRL